MSDITTVSSNWMMWLVWSSLHVQLLQIWPSQQLRLCSEIRELILHFVVPMQTHPQEINRSYHVDLLPSAINFELLCWSERFHVLTIQPMANSMRIFLGIVIMHNPRPFFVYGLFVCVVFVLCLHTNSRWLGETSPRALMSLLGVQFRECVKHFPSLPI